MKQKIFVVVAMAETRAIGNKGMLPWPEMKCDYERLVELAGDKPTIMGRNSYESPQQFLSRGHNLILTSRTLTELPANCSVVASVDEAMDYYKQEPEICILGGQRVFEEFLPKCTHLYITLMCTKAEGDAYFPEFSEDEWRLTEREVFNAGEGNPLNYEFLEYQRQNEL